MVENGRKREKTGGKWREMWGYGMHARLIATVTSLTTHMIATQAFGRRCIQREHVSELKPSVLRHK